MIKSDLTHAHLTGTTMENGMVSECRMVHVNLSQAVWGSSIMQDCNFEQAVFKGSNIQGSIIKGCDLRYCDFSELFIEKIAFDEVCFDKANFSRAVLTKSYMSKCDLSGCLMKRVTLLSMQANQCNFNGQDLSACTLEKSYFMGSSFINADLSGIKGSNCAFTNADLRGANLSYASLNNAHFDGANLTDADLSDCALNKAQLTNLDAHRLSLHRSSCQQADFSHSDLSYADLTLANFTRCVFHKVDHEHANWRGSIKLGASWDDEARANAENWQVPAQIQQEIEQALNESALKAIL